MLRHLEAIVAALATSLVALGLHFIVMGFAERSKETALAEQKAALTRQCEADKNTTKEANDALQKDAADIRRNLAAYKRLHPGTCVSVTGMAEPAAGGGEHAGQDGLGSDWLREYAAECEEYRRQRMTLDAFGARLR